LRLTLNGISHIVATNISVRRCIYEHNIDYELYKAFAFIGFENIVKKEMLIWI